MKYRELGRTGWQVSEISFGAWAIGGAWGDVDDRESLAALHRAVDLGRELRHCRDRRRVGILARVPLASGMLTGKLTTRSQFAADDHRAFNRHGESFDRGETFSGVDYGTGLQAVEELREVVPEGMTMAQFALRWILMFDAVTCAIPGARRPAQVADNAHTADFSLLTDETMRAVSEIYDRQIRRFVHHYW